jgi:hypothetical protein
MDDQKKWGTIGAHADMCLIKRLEAYAASKEWTTSKVVLKAVTEYLDRVAPVPQPAEKEATK